MALDARDRSSIYTKLIPLLGEDDANTLMSQFPGSDADELVTRGFLRAELAELRTEFHTEIGSLRTELHTEIGSLRTEIADRFRAQTVWYVGALLAGMGLCTTVAVAVG